MKAKDLMIGDWVNSRIEGKGKVIRIDREGYIAITYGNQQNAVVCKSYDLIPIPLTSEILEKNDWWLGDCKHKLESLGTTIKLNYYFGNDFTIRYDSDGKFLIERGFDNGEMELKYVHQLQMALRLFGIEKEIEL